MRFPAESDPKLAVLLEAAQQEPVFIERGDQSVAVVLSAEDYDRLTGTANLEFQEFCDTVSDRAAGLGLEEATGELIIAAMQRSPHKDIDIEPPPYYAPVSDVVL
jgi:hypothetical protein